MIWKHFEPYREKREYYLNHIDIVKDILNEGKKKAKNIASKKIELIKNSVGLGF